MKAIMEIIINKNEKKDLEAFRDLRESRKTCIHQGSKKKVMVDYPVNQLAQKIFPDSFRVKVKEIVNENLTVKTFRLEILGESEFLYPIFQPGQYITLEVLIGESIYTRAYSISCSSSHFAKNELQITIWKQKDGIVSNYFYEQVQVGDEFVARGPFGEFTYHEIRDCNHIIAAVDGHGIASILSMAESILEGSISAELTILYQAPTFQDLVFKEKLDRLCDSSDAIQVVYILEEEREGFVFGKIHKELVQQYQKSGNSYFVSGTISLYQSFNDILKELNIPNQYVRHELYRDYKVPVSGEQFQLTVFTQDREIHIPCFGNQSLLQVMEKEGIVTPRRCGVGVCGICNSFLLQGEVLTKEETIVSAKQSCCTIHPCSTYPLSDLVIQLPF